MSLWLVIVTFTIGLIAALVAAFWIMGPERVWAFFGPADLGPVAFETLERRSGPTDALACPSGFCDIDGDIYPPVYPVDVPTLRKAMARALMTERLVTRVDIDDATQTDRYVQRTEKMRFPDTIIVRYLALPNEHSTVAIYSRSQLGKNDLGANHTRIERWLSKLSREVLMIRTVP